MVKIGFLPAIIVEALLTFVLMLVNMAAATDKRFNRADSGLTVGFTIAVCGLFANSLTGGSMNPARSLGPALLSGGRAFQFSRLFAPAALTGSLYAGFAGTARKTCI